MDKCQPPAGDGVDWEREAKRLRAALEANGIAECPLCREYGRVDEFIACEQCGVRYCDEQCRAFVHLNGYFNRGDFCVRCAETTCMHCYEPCVLYPWFVCADCGVRSCQRCGARRGEVCCAPMQEALWARDDEDEEPDSIH